MNKVPKIYKKKKDCCGCNACKQVCPNSAISMKQDTEGFYYPYIDADKCVGCGLCEKVCPIKNVKNKTDDVKKSYVAYTTNDEIRLRSSSGGIFTILAEYVLETGGVVVGAAFDDGWMVHHICITNKDELEKLRGSKYVQSRIENTFKDTKKFLGEGRKVLFSGTACQIAGLKEYLRKDYEGLYTVDVLCHGVPSSEVWNIYKENYIKEYNEEIEQIFFRKKDSGWKNFTIELGFSNSKAYKEIFFKDSFMRLFLSEICLRPSCYDCKFKKLERESDLTIGDCWGIENYMPEMDDDKGTSVIMIHSDKGIKLWKNITGLLNYKEAERDKALSPNADSRKSVVPHINRKKFLKKLKSGASLEELVECVDVSFSDKVRRKCRKIICKK